MVSTFFRLQIKQTSTYDITDKSFVFHQRCAGVLIQRLQASHCQEHWQTNIHDAAYLVTHIRYQRRHCAICQSRANGRRAHFFTTL